MDLCIHMKVAFFILIMISSTKLKMGVCSPYTALYSFGDSLTDTGNRLILEPSSWSGRLPYGETFFGRPTGRFSDGRVVLDYLAQALGMPFVAPSFGNSSMQGGLNFAVGGATALSQSFLEARNISLSTIYSLDRQVDLFLLAKDHFCASYSDCNLHFEKALFFMGEFGGNDYGFATRYNYSLEELETFMEPLVNSIGGSIQRLIESGGAKNIWIQNLPPDGCLPISLANSKKDEKRDTMGCLKARNELFVRTNRALHKKILALQASFPHVSLVPLDYHKASMTLLVDRATYGMRNDILEACCGAGGPPYNVNTSLECGMRGTTECTHPNEYFSWDGTHLTDAANSIIADLMFKNIVATNVTQSSISMSHSPASLIFKSIVVQLSVLASNFSNLSFSKFYKAN